MNTNPRDPEPQVAGHAYAVGDRVTVVFPPTKRGSLYGRSGVITEIQKNRTCRVCIDDWGYVEFWEWWLVPEGSLATPEEPTHD